MLSFNNPLKKGGIAGILLVFLFLSVFACLLFLKFLPYPDLEDFLNQPYSMKYYDRTGLLLSVDALENGLYREFTPLEEIPPVLQDIFIYAEDRFFYRHPGINPFALMRSIYLNIASGRPVSGGSTITMQLARMISPRQPTIPGKIKEGINALRLELKLGKSRILELYLNNIPFAFQTQGVASGGRNFFARELWELSVPQSILLSIIPRSPEKYNPFLEKEALVKAALPLKNRFFSWISEEEISAAAASVQQISPPFLAPHFISRVRNVMKRAEIPGDYRIKTSLDYDLVQFSRERLAFYIDKYRESRINNGGVIALDNRTGEILVYIGTKDFFDDSISGWIDTVTVRNQPGSCMKPFLYALALEHGFLPNTILPDIPQDFGGENIYVPMNFDNRYHGPVRLRTALASSLNIPAVYLLERLSVQEYTDFLISFGFRSIEAQKGTLGLSLALGSGEVSLFEMARGFSVFPRRGIYKELTFFPGGSPEKEIPLVSRYTADSICSILSDRASRTLAFGRGETFFTDFPAMFKTGTANQYQHIWALGATPDITAGVWMGSLSGETVVGRTGSSVPAALVRDILSRYIRLNPEKRTSDFPEPEGSVKVKICTLSGEKAGINCPSTIEEYLPQRKEFPLCSIHASGNPGQSTMPAEGNFGFIHPSDKAVYYIDPGIPKEAQMLRVEAAAGKDEVLQFSVNGALQQSLEYPFVTYLPLRKGYWTLEIEGKMGSASLDFIVK